MLKVILLVALIQFVAVFGYPRVFMIKNVKTGKVMDARSPYLASWPWQNRNYQLWTLEPTHKPGYYFVRNVGNGNLLSACPVKKIMLTWPKHGGESQMWKINTRGPITRLRVLKFPNFFVMQINKPVLRPFRPKDNSEKWMLVHPSTV